MKRSAPRGVQPNFVRARPRVTKIPAFTHGTGPRRGGGMQISYAPVRNEDVGIHARNRPAPRGVQPNFVRARPRVTKIPAFTHGTGPRRGECSQILYAPARNEGAGIRVRKRPAPRGVQPNFVRARPRVIKKLCLLTKRQSLALRYHSCCSACAEPLETR